MHCLGDWRTTRSNRGEAATKHDRSLAWVNGVIHGQRPYRTALSHNAPQSEVHVNKGRALLSVSDKTGLEVLAKGLEERGFELISTGGTHAALKAAGLTVTYISDVTGFPEILEGRVKTLHPNVHGGILARGDQLAELESHGIKPIDLVCVNLYPFRDAVSKDGVTLQDALENIDIGGPAMIRAAAKNFPRVLVVVDPGDYDAVLQTIDLERQKTRAVNPNMFWNAARNSRRKPTPTPAVTTPRSPRISARARSAHKSR